MRGFYKPIALSAALCMPVFTSEVSADSLYGTGADWASALELLDFVVDPVGQRLIGNPAHGGEHMIDLY